MLGLLLYLVLSCITQLHVANSRQQNVNQTAPAAPTPTETLTSTPVRSTAVHSPTTTMSRSSRFAVGSSARAKPSPGSRPNPLFKIFNEDCQPALLMIGGLIIACTVLILSTLLLAWKVCLLSKRIGALSSSADLISHTERAAAKKSSPSETELREGSMLMADRLHEGKGGTEEEEEEEEEEEGAANEDKVEEAAKREEASPAPTVNSSSPAPQEEPAKADSTSELTEKPKDEV